MGGHEVGVFKIPHEERTEWPRHFVVVATTWQEEKIKFLSAQWDLTKHTKYPRKLLVHQGRLGVEREDDKIPVSQDREEHQEQVVDEREVQGHAGEIGAGVR